jgi:hypothetical protein
VIPRAEGRTVAVVGRAESLLGSGHGAAIDQADVVVRVNWTLPLAPDLAGDVGTRTDFVYHCFTICEEPREAALREGVPALRVDGRYRRALAQHWGFNPEEYRPNTGTVAVLDALDSGARPPVRIYGMDFFSSGHVGPEIRPPADAGWRWRHDPEKDRSIIERLEAHGRVMLAGRIPEVTA